MKDQKQTNLDRSEQDEPKSIDERASQRKKRLLLEGAETGFGFPTSDSNVSVERARFMLNEFFHLHQLSCFAYSSPAENIVLRQFGQIGKGTADE